MKIDRSYMSLVDEYKENRSRMWAPGCQQRQFNLNEYGEIIAGLLMNGEIEEEDKEGREHEIKGACRQLIDTILLLVK